MQWFGIEERLKSTFTHGKRACLPQFPCVEACLSLSSMLNHCMCNASCPCSLRSERQRANPLGYAPLHRDPHWYLRSHGLLVMASGVHRGTSSFPVFKDIGAKSVPGCPFCPCSPAGMRFGGLFARLEGPRRTLGTIPGSLDGALNHPIQHRSGIHGCSEQGASSLQAHGQPACMPASQPPVQGTRWLVRQVRMHACP